MSIAEEIQQWIESGKDYNAGVELFAKYCKPGQKILLRTFQKKGPTESYTIPKLEWVLWEIQKKNGIAQRDAPVTSALPVRVDKVDETPAPTTPPPSTRETPEKIKKAYREIAELDQRNAVLRENMRRATSDSARGEYAIRCDENALRIRGLWEYIERWKRTGIVEEVVAVQNSVTKVDVTDMAKVVKRIMTLRTYMSAKTKYDAERREEFRKEKEYLEGIANASKV